MSHQWRRRRDFESRALAVLSHASSTSRMGVTGWRHGLVVSHAASCCSALALFLRSSFLLLLRGRRPSSPRAARRSRRRRAAARSAQRARPRRKTAASPVRFGIGGEAEQSSDVMRHGGTRVHCSGAWLTRAAPRTRGDSHQSPRSPRPRDELRAARLLQPPPRRGATWVEERRRRACAESARGM